MGDNIPVVQAFFYVSDYVHLLQQDIGSQTDESELSRTALQSPSQYSEQSSSIPVSPAPSSIYSTDSSTQVPVPVVYTDTGDVEYVPMQPVLTYCIQDPNTGVLYYVAAPILATAAGQPGYLEAEGICE